MDLFYQYGLILIPAWINDHMSGKVWGEVIKPFQTSATAQLKFGNGKEISSHILCWL